MECETYVNWKGKSGNHKEGYMFDLKEELRQEASRIEEDTEYSAKGHYNAAERWSRYHMLIGLPSALVAALAGSAAFNDYSFLAGCLAFISTALVTVLTFLKPSEKAENHKSVAGNYLALRNRTRLFREIELPDCDDQQLMKEQLFEYAKQRNELNSSSPGISKKDYERAKKEIEAGYSTYKVDKEVS